MLSRPQAAAITSLLRAARIDFVLAPFVEDELVWRAQALVERLSHAAASQTAAPLVFGPYRFRAPAHVSIAGAEIRVAAREFELALILFRHLGLPLTREQLHAQLWSRMPPAGSRALDRQVARVREALQLRGRHGFALNAVRGIGYRIDRLPP
jgi:DNA-binding response OmpR family regulator